MPLIRIQERLAGSDNSNAIVSFNNGPEYPITINNPFDEPQEQELEWYFEEHLEFPFTKKVRAQNAATSIKIYGEELFKQIFGDPDIYAEYRDLLKAGLHDLHIEIAGSPKFHALHWESIKDTKLVQPLALQAAMVRKNLKPQAQPASVRTSPTINLLIVTARPSGAHDVGYRTISRPLVEALRPGTYRALENHLSNITAKHGEGYYHVIHFDVHGAVLTYQQFQHIQKEPAGNPFQYKRYARGEIQPLSLAAQQAMLSQDLRGKNHLLILDNLESITGVHLAKGHTLVLLGSRSGEDWLVMSVSMRKATAHFDLFALLSPADGNPRSHKLGFTRP